MEILIVDIETTGFSQKYNKIVEVGIVSLNLNNGDINVLFDAVTKEYGLSEIEITNSWIVSNSSLSVESVMVAPLFEFFKSKIQSIINEYELGITAYNNGFDFSFLEFRDIKIPKKLPCPMVLSRDICKALNKNGVIKNPSVEEAYNHFFPNSNYIELHRAADDAKHEAGIVYELYKRNIFKI